MSSFLRPDEKAAQAEIERAQKFKGNIQKGATAIAGIGAAAAGGALSSKILPFLNEFIPSDLAIKGISKISPKLGNFLKQGQSMGLDVKEGLDFIKNKIQPNNQGTITDDLIEKYSPELSKFVENLFDQGEQLETVDALIRNVPKNFNRFKDSINKIETHAGQPFKEILEKIYGNLLKGKKNNTKNPIKPSTENPPTAVQPNEQKQGGATNELMQALQMAAQARQKRAR